VGIDANRLQHVPLARVTRGDAIDSVHYGSVAVVDGDGRLIYAAGNPEHVTTTRSALKPAVSSASFSLRRRSR
jgi:L-asparaginase II